MGKLIYSLTTTLDGYACDPEGNFDWATPSEEIHAFINDVLKDVDTFLLGRRVWETLAVWDTIDTQNASKAVKDFAEIWRGAEKVVFSHTLTEPPGPHARLEHSFDVEKIRQLKRGSDGDLNIGGPHLAAYAIRAGLVDEYHQYVVPVIIGAGTNWLPKEVHLKLELTDVRKFDNGTVHLAYRPKS